MKIESIKLKNYKTFQDVHLTNLPEFMILVGANGTGKTTFFDVFGFLHDCLTGNVRSALDRRGRFQEVRSRGASGNILIEIQYRMQIVDKPRLVTYTLEIGEKSGRPIIIKESLRYKRGRYGAPYYFLRFSEGKGYAISNEEDYSKSDEELEREEASLSPDILAIKGLGQFDRFKAASAFRKLIESWHVSDFHITSARGRVETTGESEHLSQSGDNLPRYAQYLHEQHKVTFNDVIRIMSKRVPGVSNIEPILSDDGYLTLKFQDGSFQTPFLDRYVSDGTIKMFAYLTLLYDPYPHPLLCVEEPENQLYPLLMTELAEEFRLYGSRGGQVFVSTHSPEFLNAAELEEVYWLVKASGYTKILRASENAQVKDYVNLGDKLGYLWKQDFFEGASPK
jgi:predicted ATPase